jgi:WD40 repeat protein
LKKVINIFCNFMSKIKVIIYLTIIIIAILIISFILAGCSSAAIYYPLGPTFSPDGSRIVFVSEVKNKGDIFIMNSDGKGKTNLTNSSVYEKYPAWSPDGSRIVFGSDKGDILVINADGTNKIDLTKN